MKDRPKAGERFSALVNRLADELGRDPERARPALTDAIGARITLTPDKSGKFLWAEYGLEGAPFRAALGVPEIMVAGACTVNFLRRCAAPDPASAAARARAPARRRYSR